VVLHINSYRHLSMGLLLGLKWFCGLAGIRWDE
jgi:hypothetical protein